jgi:c-di-GMP-binding flagellar brake protein YcgR
MQAVMVMELPEKAAELATERQNRRATPRYRVDEDARLLLVKHGSTLSCRIVDISLNGCRICTQERFSAGILIRVEVTFKVRGFAFRFSGVTQWTDGRYLLGVRFVDVPARRIEELVEALCEVEAENAAKAAQQAAQKPDVQDTEALDSERDGGSTPRIKPTESRLALQAAEKLVALKGHDFSRAVIAAKSMGPLGSEGCFSEVQIKSRPFSATYTAQLASEGRAPAMEAAAPPPREQAKPEPAQPTEAQKAEAPPVGPSQAKPARRERREQSRHEVDTSAVIFLVNVASRLTGRILDLSLGGCRICTDERFPVGIYTRVETEFRLEGLPFRLGGVIQAIHDRRHVGIRFLDMSSRKREQLEQLVREIEELRERGKGNRESLDI